MLKRWLITGILALFAICVGFGDKKRLRYLYKLHATPIIQSIQQSFGN